MTLLRSVSTFNSILRLLVFVKVALSSDCVTQSPKVSVNGNKFHIYSLTNATYSRQQ